jgi:plastocyanin domain-containing protein
MFLFSLGTSPLMFSFGAAGSLLSKKFTSKMMAVSAVLVIVLGLGMFNTGLGMAGFLGVGTETSDVKGFEPVIIDGYQMVEIDVSPRAYAPITVKNGIPVIFNLRAEGRNINGCNNAIFIPEYGIEMPITPGDNIVEFTPTRTGVIPYSCWMNMIRSSITVVE